MFNEYDFTFLVSLLTILKILISFNNIQIKFDQVLFFRGITKY